MKRRTFVAGVAFAVAGLARLPKPSVGRLVEGPAWCGYLVAMNRSGTIAVRAGPARRTEAAALRSIPPVPWYCVAVGYFTVWGEVV